jgi:putative endonuclease
VNEQRRRLRQERGGRSRREGRRAEWLCALMLMARGWRILGFRVATPQGEIDILARRGDVLAVIEVKRRASLEAALEAVTPRQRERLIRAARAIAGRRPDLAAASVRLDLIALAPGRPPRHIADAWRGE